MELKRSESPSGIRRCVLRETLEAFETESETAKFHRLAQSNLARWKRNASIEVAGCDVRVMCLDWGEAVANLTKEFGTTFACLNMANAYCFGGGYVEGCIAQEENMFRRTDCHFSIGRSALDPHGMYLKDQTRLLNGKDGIVSLDVDRPRVCIRGSEDRSRPDLGYRWLDDDEVFPFYELRAAAVDLRKGYHQFNPDETRRRIQAQFLTLRNAGIKHAVLSAFGCGAFRNPAEEVARLYYEEVLRVQDYFQCIAFAIFHAGYGRDNYLPFAQAFSEYKARPRMVD